MLVWSNSTILDQENIQEVTSYLQICWKISLGKPFHAFQRKIFDNESECKIQRMNFLEKFKIKHYDNLHTIQPQDEEDNAIQYSFTETPITYKNAMKLSVPKL